MKKIYIPEYDLQLLEALKDKLLKISRSLKIKNDYQNSNDVYDVVVTLREMLDHYLK